ncbi:MAG: site-2 protease family protein, partial [Aurantibacter sp.]
DGNKIEEFGSVFLEIVNGNSITIERDGRTIEQEIPVDFIATLLEDEDKIRFLNYRLPFTIAEVSKGSPNTDSGFEKNDKVIAVNGKSIRFRDELIPYLEENKGGHLDLVVKRENGATENVQAKVSDDGLLGVTIGGLTMKEVADRGFFRIETKKYSFLEAIPAGIDKGVTTLSSYVKQLKKIFNPETGAYKGVGGFAAIGGLFPDTWNWPAFWNTTAFISIILAFMNILPIPALDGGHVTFLLYEMVTGRKPSDKFLEYAQMTGFFILIALLLFANGNDLYKWLFK